MILGNLGSTVLFIDAFSGIYKKGWIIYTDHKNVTIKSSDGSIYFNPHYNTVVSRMVLFEKFTN